MTRDGLTEENLRDGSVKDISHRSRGRPENKEEFVPERERKKAENEDSKSGKGKRLQMEKIRKSSARQEAVEDTVEVTPEEKVSGYRKKLHRYEKIPDDDNNLNSQKKSIRKKQLQKQMTKEQAKAGRLSFDDEGNQMVKGAGMKPGGTAGKYIATQAVISGMKAVSSEEEETDENAGVESARLVERETEDALRGLRHAQIRSKRTDVKTHRRGYREATVEKKLKFGSAESMEGVKNAETVKKAEQKRHFYNRFFQKKRYKDAYRAARAGKSAGSLGGATTIAGVENMTVKAKIALKEIIKRNRAMFAGIGIFALLFLVIAVSLGSCSASIEGAGSVIGITTYPSSDEDIYAAENRYAALESALNQQINEMERRHPNYDEYQYNIAEIGHNPYHLISYLTAKYGDWTYSDVENELQSLFEAQYHLNTEGRTKTVTETRNVRVGESLGQVVTSGYCNCRICCGVWSGGPTASGAYPTANHTIAVDASNPFVPIGTKVVMNGVEYTVEDTGAFARYGVQFDVYYDNHAAASAHGHQTWEAYIADDNGSQEVTVTSTSTKKILYVTLTNGSFDAVARANLNAEQLIIYNALNTTYGNRNYLWDGKQFYLMEHQVYRDQAQGVILDAYGKMVVEECKKFDEKTKQKIHDYIQQQVPLNPVEQLKQDGKIRLEHYQKFYQNGTYERSRESGTEANYDMVDGLVNNQKKNQEKTSDASSNNQTSRNQQDGKSKKRRSVIKRLHQKQIAIARRSGKPIPKYLDQEMERKRG